MNRNYSGLSTSEVEDRIALGRVNAVNNSISKTKKEILKTHLFTFFNFLNLFLGALVISTGQIKNLLFMMTIICNAVIGIVQELRVKSMVDKLSVITASKAKVIRDGKKVQIGLDEIVMDDIMVLESGDQIGADCKLLDGQGVEVNESMITGESVAVKKKKGDEMLSGSFLTAGSCLARVIHVGEENYATILAAKAKNKKRASSEMQNSINRIIKVVGFIIVPVGIMLFISQSSVAGTTRSDAIVNTVAGVIGMIPEGLVLLTSVSFIVGVGKLAMKQALVQEIEAIESLARVNVLCLDKTGTITTGNLEVEEIVPLGDMTEGQIKQAMSEITYAFNDVNPTQQALMNYFPKTENWKAQGLIPFSSARKFRAVSFGADGAYVLGAPEFIMKDSLAPEKNAALEKKNIRDGMPDETGPEKNSRKVMAVETGSEKNSRKVMAVETGPEKNSRKITASETGIKSRIHRINADGTNSDSELSAGNFDSESSNVNSVSELSAGNSVPANPGFDLMEKCNTYALQGYRVILLARAESISPEDGRVNGPKPEALIVISDCVREEAPSTFAYFRSQGVDIKVISGDNPATVSQIALKAGLLTGDKYIDAQELPEDDFDFRKAVSRYTVFGRVTPEQKQRLVKAYQDQGHVVGMVGDGVNDVLALKDADCGIAMAAGSDAARQVAHIVLLDSDFVHLKDVVKEGRSIISNIERVSSLYLTKTIYSVLLCIIFIILSRSYPFVPIHLTLISTVAIGIPSFFLALEPNDKVTSGGFLMHVLRTALPGALTMVVSMLLIQLVSDLLGLDSLLTSTYNLIVLGIVSLMVLSIVSSPKNKLRKIICYTMDIIFIVCVIGWPDLFSIESIFNWRLIFLVPITVITALCFNVLRNVSATLFKGRGGIGTGKKGGRKSNRNKKEDSGKKSGLDILKKGFRKKEAQKS